MVIPPVSALFGVGLKTTLLNGVSLPWGVSREPGTDICRRTATRQTAEAM
jgi:hypothetical protein